LLKQLSGSCRYGDELCIIGFILRMKKTGFQLYFLLVLLACVASGVSTAQAQSLFPISGAVYAPSPCALSSSAKAGLCIQYIVPLQTRIVARSGRRAYRIISDADGAVSAKLPRGRYALKVAKILYKGEELGAHNFVVTPGHVTVSARAAVGLLVAHRSAASPIE
jgi:hypothetical protein